MDALGARRHRLQPGRGRRGCRRTRWRPLSKRVDVLGRDIQINALVVKIMEVDADPGAGAVPDRLDDLADIPEARRPDNHLYGKILALIETRAACVGRAVRRSTATPRSAHRPTPTRARLPAPTRRRHLSEWSGAATGLIRRRRTSGRTTRPAPPSPRRLGADEKVEQYPGGQRGRPRRLPEGGLSDGVHPARGPPAATRCLVAPAAPAAHRLRPAGPYSNVPPAVVNGKVLPFFRLLPNRRFRRRSPTRTPCSSRRVGAEAVGRSRHQETAARLLTLASVVDEEAVVLG